MDVANNPKLYYWITLIGAINFLSPVITLFYLHRGLQLPDLFILLLCIVVSMFVFEVPTGMFADKYGYKNSFIVGQLVFVIGTIILIFAQAPIIFYLTGIITGLGITFFSGAQEGFIFDSLKEVGKEKKTGAVMGKINSALLIPAIGAAIIGPIIGKDLLEWQFVLIILLTALFATARLVMTFFLVEPKKHKKLTRVFAHVDEGWRTIRTTPLLLFIFLNEILVFIPLHIFDNVIKQPYLLDSGLPVVFFGFLFATRALLGAFASHHIGWLEKRFSWMSIIITTNMLILFSYLAGALLNNTILLAAGLVLVLGTANVIRAPIFSHIKNFYIPDGSRATTLSLLSMIDSAFDILIFTSLSFISGWGIPAIFLGSAAVVLIGMFMPIKIPEAAQSRE